NQVLIELLSRLETYLVDPKRPRPVHCLGETDDVAASHTQHEDLTSDHAPRGIQSQVYGLRHREEEAGHLGRSDRQRKILGELTPEDVQNRSVGIQNITESYARESRFVQAGVVIGRHEQPLPQE